MNVATVAPYILLADSFKFADDLSAASGAISTDGVKQWVKTHLEDTPLKEHIAKINAFVGELDNAALRIVNLRSTPQQDAPHFFCFELVDFYGDNNLICGFNGQHLTFINKDGKALLRIELNHFFHFGFHRVISFITDYLDLTTYKHKVTQADGTVVEKTFCSAFEALSSHLAQTDAERITFVVASTDDVEIHTPLSITTIKLTDKLEINTVDAGEAMKQALDIITTYLKKPEMAVELNHKRHVSCAIRH